MLVVQVQKSVVWPQCSKFRRMQAASVWPNSHIAASEKESALEDARGARAPCLHPAQGE